MIAENLAEIIQRSQNHKTSFLYEAAVADGISILRNLDTCFTQNKNQKINAILNGASNYILTQLFQTQCNYDQALKQAQENGYTKIGYIIDVGGYDTKYKAVILAAHAFGILIHPDLVRNYGIQNISAKDIEFAKAHQLVIKLVLTIEKTASNCICITVMPEFLHENDELAKTGNRDNTIIVNNNDTSFLFKGTGFTTTATTIAIDLKASTKNYRYNYNIDKSLVLDTNFSLKLYINKNHLNQPVNGKILKETDDYLIINIDYNELLKIDTTKTFIAKIN